MQNYSVSDHFNMDSLSFSLPNPHRYGRTVVWKFESVTDAFLKVFAFVSPFFHRADLYLPLNAKESEPNLIKQWQDSENAIGEYAVLPQVHLEALINHSTFRQAASQGLISGLSVDRRLDVDDVFAFLPPLAPEDTRSGALSIPQLILSVQRDTFTSLGLVQSNALSNLRQKSLPTEEVASAPFLVSVDLRSKKHGGSFEPEKNGFKRTISALQRLPPVDMVISIPHTNSKDVEWFPEHIKHTKGYLNSHRSRIRNIRVPVIPDPSQATTQTQKFDWTTEESIDNLLLYFGAVPHRMLKLIAGDSADEFASSLSSIELPFDEDRTEISISSFQGFISGFPLLKLASNIKTLFEQTQCPWIAVQLWPVLDVPTRISTYVAPQMSSSHATLIVFRSGYCIVLATDVTL